jgi:uncharacterized protein YebE (UPF0316 family)
MPEGQVLLGALAIFGLRIFGIAISTVRMLIMVQGRRFWSSVLGFLEALVFAVAIGGVVNELDNFWNMLAYCGGFSVGTYLGMVLEDWVITSFVSVNIVSKEHAHAVAEAIRKAGFGATESWGQGAVGMVGLVRAVVNRRDVPRVVECVNAIDPQAFVTLDETRGVMRGFLRMPQHPHG